MIVYQQAPKRTSEVLDPSVVSFPAWYTSVTDFNPLSQVVVIAENISILGSGVRIVRGFEFKSSDAELSFEKFV